MIAGLISQVVTMALFLALWADFALKMRRARGRTGKLGMYEALKVSSAFKWFQWSKFFERDHGGGVADSTRLIRRNGPYLCAVHL